MEKGWVKRNKWIFFVAPLAFAVFIWIGGEIVMHLWNWLLPALFGWQLITFWQALGLLVLCRILFGGLCHGHGSDRSYSHRKWAEHCERMTPEEREKLRQDLRARSGGAAASANEIEGAA
ncbi:MAG: hypothetical protein ABSC48_18645 [Terracidiphilus sp.]|jgi:hypothetical protein